MSDIRWLALLPDPVTGTPAPVQLHGAAREWLAPDRVEATKLVRRSLSPQQFACCEVVSVVDYQERRREPKRPASADWRPPSFLSGRHRRTG